MTVAPRSRPKQKNKNKIPTSAPGLVFVELQPLVHFLPSYISSPLHTVTQKGRVGYEISPSQVKSCRRRSGGGGGGGLKVGDNFLRTAAVAKSFIILRSCPRRQLECYNRRDLPVAVFPLFSTMSTDLLLEFMGLSLFVLFCFFVFF